MNCPIDEKIYQELRKVLNETEIFCCEKEYLKLYNLGYALLERVEKGAAYVNEHIEPPSTDEEFFLIMMYGAMLVDAAGLLLKELIKAPIKRASRFLTAILRMFVKIKTCNLMMAQFPQIKKYGNTYEHCLLHTHLKQVVHSFWKKVKYNILLQLLLI